MYHYGHLRWEETDIASFYLHKFCNTSNWYHFLDEIILEVLLQKSSLNDSELHLTYEKGVSHRLEPSLLPRAAFF